VVFVAETPGRQSGCAGDVTERKGTVLWFDRQVVGGRRNVIMHRTAVERSGLIGLVPGQEIEFRLVPWGGYHMRADNLRLIAACTD
jgi:cold shock CspA family protein